MKMRKYLIRQRRLKKRINLRISDMANFIKNIIEGNSLVQLSLLTL